MDARFILIAVAALTSVSASAAEPVKPPPQQVSQQQRVSAQVVLASADSVPHSPGVEQQSPPPAKPHRVARVTTCRCADLVPQSTDDQQ